MFNAKQLLNDLCFNSEEFEKMAQSYKDLENPYFVALLAKEAKKEGLDEEANALETFLKEFNKLETKVSREDIKEVYIKLKEGKENPKGTFDSQGRFYLRDCDLLPSAVLICNLGRCYLRDCEIENIISQSTKSPYSQTNSGRTAAFVNALAAKYKCQNLQELEAVAFD